MIKFLIKLFFGTKEVNKIEENLNKWNKNTR